MKLGELLDQLHQIEQRARQIFAFEESVRELEIVVRGMDEDGQDFCGALISADVEESHDGETLFVALDASNAPDIEDRE